MLYRWNGLPTIRPILINYVSGCITNSSEAFIKYCAEQLNYLDFIPKRIIVILAKRCLRLDIDLPNILYNRSFAARISRLFVTFIRSSNHPVVGSLPKGDGTIKFLSSDSVPENPSKIYTYFFRNFFYRQVYGLHPKNECYVSYKLVFI